MNDFLILYRLLKTVQAYENVEEQDALLLFNAERLRTTERQRDNLMLKLVNAGYVEGVTFIQDSYFHNRPAILWSESQPYMTIEGLEYLYGNQYMQDAANGRFFDG